MSADPPPSGAHRLRPETVIAAFPPSDGRDWECQCARCGSSASSVDCESCDDGFDGHDCGEDCCCCEYPDDNVRCQFCRGLGHWYACLSGVEWCEAHPLPGREKTPSGAIEWFVVDERRSAP